MKLHLDDMLNAHDEERNSTEIQLLLFATFIYLLMMGGINLRRG